MLLAQHQSWSGSRAVFRQAFRLLVTHWKAVAMLWVVQGALFILYAFVSVVLSRGGLQSFLSGFLSLTMAIYQLAMIGCLIHLANDRRTRGLMAMVRESVFVKIPAMTVLALLIAVGTLVATFAFVIPGVILYIFWSLAIFVLVVEDTSVRVALQRSVELIRGWWWPMLSRFLFLVSIITVQTALGYVPVVGSIVSTMMSVVLVPVSIWYFYLTYKELVDIKGFKHLQAAHVSVGSKFVLLCWAFFIFTALAFVTAGAAFVSDSIRANPAFLPRNDEPWFFLNGPGMDSESILTPVVK